MHGQLHAFYIRNTSRLSTKSIYTYCSKDLNTVTESVTDIQESILVSGDPMGELQFSHGITTDQDGFLYVCDTFSDRIQIF